MSPSSNASPKHRRSKPTTAKKPQPRLQQYTEAPPHEDAFSKPEGVSKRTKRLVEEIDSMITAFQFAEPAANRRSKQGRKPSHQLLRYINAPAYLPGERIKMRRVGLMADMDAMLSQIQGVLPNVAEEASEPA